MPNFRSFHCLMVACVGRGPGSGRGWSAETEAKAVGWRFVLWTCAWETAKYDCAARSRDTAIAVRTGIQAIRFLVRFDSVDRIVLVSTVINDGIDRPTLLCTKRMSVDNEAPSAIARSPRAAAGGISMLCTGWGAASSSTNIEDQHCGLNRSIGFNRIQRVRLRVDLRQV